MDEPQELANFGGSQNTGKDDLVDSNNLIRSKRSLFGKDERSNSEVFDSQAKGDEEEVQPPVSGQYYIDVEQI